MSKLTEEELREAIGRLDDVKKETGDMTHYPAIIIQYGKHKGKHISLEDIIESLRSRLAAKDAEIEELKSQLMTFQDISKERLIQSWIVQMWFEELLDISNKHDTDTAKLKAYEWAVKKIIEKLDKGDKQ
jgi:hypothetical protein